jgi:hypothetical protein
LLGNRLSLNFELMYNFLIPIGLVIAMTFVIYAIISLIVKNDVPAEKPKGKLPEKELLIDKSTSIFSTTVSNFDNEENHLNLVTEKRVDFLVEKLFEAGTTLRGIANTIILSILLSILGIILLYSGKEILYIVVIVDWVFVVICSFVVIGKIYSAGASLMETKKYFKFNPQKISSRSKDPYFNR